MCVKTVFKHKEKNQRRQKGKKQTDIMKTEIDIKRQRKRKRQTDRKAERYKDEIYKDKYKDRETKIKRYIDGNK